MKTRNGFISNSSSSSFCVVGTNFYKDVARLLRACGWKGPTALEPDVDEVPDQDFGYGTWTGHAAAAISFYGRDGVEGTIVGIDLDGIRDMSVDAVAEEFVALAKELGVKLEKPEHIRLHYGEMSSE